MVRVNDLLYIALECPVITVNWEGDLVLQV